MDQDDPGIPQDGGDSRTPHDGTSDEAGPGNTAGLGNDAGLGVLAAVAALEAARAAVEALAAIPLWSLPDVQAREVAAGRFALEKQLHAGYLASLADLDSRPGVVPKARPGTQGRTFAVHDLHRSPAQAGADVRAAHALAPDADPAAGGLPRLGAALAAGEISREHAQVGVRAIRRLPKDLLAAAMDDEPGISPRPAAGPAAWCRGDLVDHLLTEYSKKNDPGTVDQLAQYMLNAADPDGSHSFDPKAAQRRGLSLVTDQTGMGILRGELDPATAANLRAALEAYARPDPARTETAEDGSLIQITDTRTGRQRYADAIGQIARAALAARAGATRGGEPPRIVIHAGPETVADAMRQARTGRSAGAATTARTTGTGPASGTGGPTGSGTATGSGATSSTGSQSDTGSQGGRPGGHSSLAEFGTGGVLSPQLLSQFTCDSLLQSVLLARSGAVLNLGRDVRTVSPAQRRALVARDRGCVVPGCTAPAHHCEGHHIRWWRHQGETNIANLALVCSRHHTEIHSGVWGLTVKGGIPWAIPPDWIDPARRPLRNTYRDDTATFHQLGLHLRLGTDPPSTGRSGNDAEKPDVPRAGEDQSAA